MISTPLLLSLSLLAPSQNSAQVHLRWAPELGTPVTHQWLTGHQILLESFSRTVNGDKQSAPMRWSITSERWVVATDQYRSLAGARPLEFRRVYDRIEQKSRLDPIGMEGAPTSELNLTSPMEGVSVVWNWVESEGEFGRYFDGVEGREELLPNLREDLSLRALLPEGPVAVGASWVIQPLGLRDILDPGGDLNLATDKGSRVLRRCLGAGVGGDLHRAFNGENSGLATATLKSVEGGQARVRLVLDRVRFVADLTRYVQESTLGREEMAFLEPISGRLVIDFTGAGDLVWDLNSNQPTSFALKATEQVEMWITLEGEQTSLVEQMRMAGSFNTRYGAAVANLRPAVKAVKPADEKGK
jgi:hypothetical protein